MPTDLDAIPARMFLFRGWAVLADRGLASSIDDDPDTLTMSDSTRSVSIGAMRARSHAGDLLSPEQVFALYPPPEWPGLRLAHHDRELHGAALQLEAADDETGKVQWVLFAVLVDAPSHTVLRCTITVDKAEDREWAIAVWRAIFYYAGDNARLRAELLARGLVDNLPAEA